MSEPTVDVVSPDAAAYSCDAEVLAGAVFASAGPKPLDSDGRFVAITVPKGGATRVVDLEELAQATSAYPRWKTGAYAAHTPDSFVAYVNRHQTQATEVFASRADYTLIAVIDSHAVDLAGRGAHQATLRMRTTPGWAAWLALDRKLVSQVDFAEHIEERLVDIVEPDAATFLEICQSLLASTSVEFESAHRLVDGQSHLVYRETTTASAGQRHDLEIPARFVIGVAPWQGAAPWKVSARLRYRINHGALAIGYILDRATDMAEHAFDEVVAGIATGVDPVPVFHGWPHTPAA
jgi:uncharacterized protein YfdQ (DUF2303 family)